MRDSLFSCALYSTTRVLKKRGLLRTSTDDLAQDKDV
jgi:hypothetical protein